MLQNYAANRKLLPSNPVYEFHQILGNKWEGAYRSHL
jgi:hypothetical protein